MQCHFTSEKLAALVLKQINNFWEVSVEDEKWIYKYTPEVLNMLNSRFLHIKNKYYCDHNSNPVFDPLHNGQYTMFLYELSHRIYRKTQSGETSSKIYNILKIISSADIYYEINLPDIYFFDHPVGTVLGRANYSNYFLFGQGCTVGNNKGKYPTLGEHVYMMSGSKILGDCRIGDRVILASNTSVIDTDIPDDSIVFGSGKQLVIKPMSEEKFLQVANGYWNL